MNLHRRFHFILITGMFLFSTGCIKAVRTKGTHEKPQLPAYQHSKTEGLVRFVDKVVEAIQERGEDTFPEFRRKGSEWFRGDRYIFVCGLDGHRYVYPPDPDIEGKNMLHLKDINGKPIGMEFVEAALSPQGRGWAHYKWAKPGMDKPEWKSTYIRSVTAPSGKEYLVGSGMYNKKIERAFVIHTVEDTVNLLEKDGRNAFSKIASPDSRFIYLDLYVFIKDMKGNELVNPYNEELVGKNILQIKDIYGKEFVKREIDILRENETCWMDYWWHKPNETEPSQKIVFLKKAEAGGETLIVGSGYYPDIPVYGLWEKQIDLDEGRGTEASIRINPDNTFEFLFPPKNQGHNNTSGRIAVQDNLIYFYDNECTDIGVYEVTVVNRQLNLKVINDTCSIRKMVLEGVWNMNT